MSDPDDRRTAPAPDPQATVIPSSQHPGAPLTVGQVLGGRYEVRGLLGRGGMGEVWHAFDLKLRVEVALKALREDLFGDERRRELLRQEVRAAREVVSPHVCRVFDLVEVDGHELVSMEYIDGQTLLDVLQERGPLELKEAQEIASQFLAGLEAIHKAGIVHRDVKPENIMRTRAGRVVVMDLGLAKEHQDSAGSVSGTPAYMAPEQARGAVVDARADVYAAGVVLAEMVSPGGIRDFTSRQSVWEGIHHEPAQVPDTPWAPVLKKAVAKEPAQRYATAHTLIRALEDVTLRVQGAEDLRPYPGLASFTEADAEYFFGRETEVEHMWRKLEGPARLLALVGPSGAGKSSFVQAGLIPSAPAGWAVVRCTPGDAALASVRAALIPQLGGDTEVVQVLVTRPDDPAAIVAAVSAWRRRHEHALLIVDQFEELFTLNPPEAQRRCAELLGRLPLEADVHVLLSLRDDFLMACHGLEALRPLASEPTLLDPPSGANIRRALVQPALKCGYRFEDERLVSEMLQAVEGERGALPLLAFAVASLWERRDRAQGLLTRAAHDAIGGVAGALAQHAEATLERIGSEKLSLVRELFRNLVTAEGTRAVRDVGELLSVFPEDQRTSAEGVLKALIDARLLTSYEAHATEPGQRAGRRVEVVHESLLSAWPRLVRWRTEDEGSAQLRDQLRQVAHLWEEKGKPDDLLWTGTSFQEYQVWRARYPGGLSEIEEAYGRAMAALANHRRRVRRLAVAAVIALLAGGLAVVGSFWRRSVRETRRAEGEAAQREAAQLLALGRLRLADHPMAALAYAVASLGRSDNEPARRFAVQTLAQGPPAFFLDDPVQPLTVAWSPDGRRLALGGQGGLSVVDRSTGERRQLGTAPENVQGFTQKGDRLVTRSAESGPANPSKALHVWTFPEGRLERSLDLPAPAYQAVISGDRVLALSFERGWSRGATAAVLTSLPLDGTAPQVLGRFSVRDYHGASVIDATSGRFLSMEGGRLTERRLEAVSAPERVIGIGTEGQGTGVYLGPWPDRAFGGDSHGEVRVWDLATGRVERTLASPADARFIAFDPAKRFLATGPTPVQMLPRSLFLFDLDAPRSAEPVPMLDSDLLAFGGMRFSPDGAWLASAHGGATVLWRTWGSRSLVVGHQAPPYLALAFDGKGGLLSTSNEGVVRRWPLSATSSTGVRALWSRRLDVGMAIGAFIDVDAQGKLAVVRDVSNPMVIAIPLDGAPARTYTMAAAVDTLGTGSLDPSGRYLALNAWPLGDAAVNAVHILDLETGAERILDAHPKAGEGCEKADSPYAGWVSPAWIADGRLVTDGDTGLRVWDLANGTSRLLRPCRNLTPPNFAFLVSRGPRAVVRLDAADAPGSTSSLSVFDLASGSTREITSHGDKIESFALDPTGEILVTGDKNGLVRVGSLSGEEPHLLFGHTATVLTVAVSPDGRWIASGSEDSVIRLWPMPDLSRPPMHTLPHDELLAKLESLTNLRAVRDSSSDTGWKLEVGPFPGWASYPEWQP